MAEHERISEASPIPTESDIRPKITEYLELFFAESPESAIQCAKQSVIDHLGIDNQDLMNFAEIEAENVMNRCHYTYVPIEERILLIPHCLRNPDKCKAPIDDEGYHCQKCGACVIGEITMAAEARGLKWYMVGGGSHAIRIVKNARPRAVLGIACFDEARMAVDKIAEYGIPTQAVLLCKDGCVNTEVEFDQVILKLDVKKCE